MIRRLYWWEIPDEIPYIPGVQNWGGGCEHEYHSYIPGRQLRLTCGRRGLYLREDGARVCWSHLAADLVSRSVYGVPWQTSV